MSYEFLNLISYQNSLAIMEEKISEVVQQKKCFVYGLEHELIYTAGLKTSSKHILKDIPYVKSRRGGSITVHNPGQLVHYCVFPLSAINNALEKYIRALEVSMINTLANYNSRAFQDREHTGVWTENGKIGFVGIAAKKGAVYHGAALNVKNNLDDYKPVVSCGLNLPIMRLIDEPGANVSDLSLGNISKQWFHEFVRVMNQNFTFGLE